MLPHLNCEGLTKDEMDELYSVLHDNYNSVHKKFCILVGKTLRSLKTNNISPGELIVLINNYVKPKKKLFSKVKSLEQIFACKNWYSFFDYEVLEVIIPTYCTKLGDDLKEYIRSFEAYCSRKLSEVPSYFKSTSGGNNFIIRVKIKKEFSEITLSQLKEMENRLKKITKIHLNLLRFEEGCIVLAFESLCEEDDMLPLTKEEKKELFEMDVLRLYSDNKEYFDQIKYSCSLSGEYLHATEPSTTVCSETSVGKPKKYYRAAF